MDTTYHDMWSLTKNALLSNGCDDRNSAAVATTVASAEWTGSRSHGLFRVPGYIKSLRSRKVDGHASPEVTHPTPAIVSVDANNGFAPLALEEGVEALTKVVSSTGVAALMVRNSYHFAALWHETFSLASRGYAALAVVCSTPLVAPFGSKKAFFGTNPISFAFPRKVEQPLVFDMATSTMAHGDVQIAAREGRQIPSDVGLSPSGSSTTDPNEVLDGILLPFGGYKGSLISLMVELMAAGLVGDNFSYEAELGDNGDGGPARGGEFIVAFSPEILAGPGWDEHCAAFFTEYAQQGDTYLPGESKRRLADLRGTVTVDNEIYRTIRNLTQINDKK